MHIPQSEWTSAEQWAWDRIRADEAANFHTAYGWLDPKEDDEGWSAPERQLRSGFIEALFVDTNLREHLPRRGVRLLGARLAEGLDLWDMDVPVTFWFDLGRIDGKLELSDAKFHKALSLRGSMLHKVTADRLTVGSDLFLRDKTTVHDELRLPGASISGSLEMSGSTFQSVNAERVTVGSGLFLRDKATVHDELLLLGANISGNLEMGGSAFQAISADGMTVDGDLFLHNEAMVISKLRLLGADIGGQLNMRDSSFSGEISAQNLKIGSHFLCDQAEYLGEVDLFGANIGGGLNLCQAHFHGIVDFTSAKITDDFTLAFSPSEAPTWEVDSCLKLRNAHVGALQAAPDPDAPFASWPSCLDLRGFSSQRLGGVDGDGEHDLLHQPATWFAGLLERDKHAGPQPYQHFAKLLRQAGENGKADDLLYLGRKRERKEAWKRKNWWRTLGLLTLEKVCGFGIGRYTFRVLLWMLGLTIFGTAALVSTPHIANHIPWYWLPIISLDQLLPVIDMSWSAKAIFDAASSNLTGCAQVYFALHSLFGYILAIFALAAFSGLTQGRKVDE